MDKILALKRIEMNLNVSQVLETLINIASGMKDKEGLIAIVSALSTRELEVYKTEAMLRVKIMDIVSQFYNKRIQEYREVLKKQLFLSSLRRITVERKAMELASKDANTFVEILSGKEKADLLQGGRQVLTDAVKELMRLLKSAHNLDISQIAGNLKNAIQ